MKKLLYTFIFSLLVLMSSSLSAQVQTNLDKGMRFVEQNAQKWGLQESDYANSMVSDMYTNKKTGITYIYLIQAHKGIPIHNAITPIIIDTKGDVRIVRHGYIANAKELISVTKPSLEPVAAIKSAASHFGIVATEMPSLKKSISATNTYEFGNADFVGNELVVKLMYIKDGNEIKLAWNLAIDELDNPDYYNTFVDATSGEIISKFNFTVKCTHHKGKYDKHVGCSSDHSQKSKISTFAEASAVVSAAAMGGSYNVFALPTESPIHGERSIVVDPAFTDASPFGWHDTNQMEGAEFTITRGNNVHAYLDKENSGSSSFDEPDGGDNLLFDEAYDVNNEAVDNEQGATVNLFYAVNMVHDITSRLGFDEPAGNFQQNNYGNGGNGNDYVLAEASDGSAFPDNSDFFNNANFTTFGDGGKGEMQMYLWNNPSGLLSIDEPAELAGFVGGLIEARDAETGLLLWGGEPPSEQEAPVTGRVVIAKEDTPGEPTTGCFPIKNVSEVTGNIAMIDRGLCDFSLKAYHAQEAGAISVLICNVEGGTSLGGMSAGENADLVTINALLLPTADCDRIKASMLAGIPVTVTLQSRGPVGPEYFDGSVDNGIVIHEYGHGISNRLVGGPGQASCLTSLEQAGEGISDFFSLVLTVEEGDKGTDIRGIGNYADGQKSDGLGIRSFPYSTDVSVNPIVYDDIKTRSPVVTESPHALGEVWTVALWEVYWAFVDAFGLDTTWEDEESGNFKAVRLAIEGMKGSPCNPSLIDLRDGVLNADSTLYGGENAGLLWIAFAKRGFGYLADDGAGSNDVSDGTQSFEPLPLAIRELKISVLAPGHVEAGEEATIELSAVNHIPETQNNVVITTEVPNGMTYVDGSATMAGTLDNGVLTFEVGDMAFLDELRITYKVKAASNTETLTVFYDNVDDADEDLYKFGFTEGFNLWVQSFDVANSEDASWTASQLTAEDETDFYMTAPPMEVLGNRPALKFANRFDTEVGSDGGFLMISTDGIIFEIANKFLRNGYNSSIQYGTFAIPLLEAFSGTTNEEFIYSYLDLSDYKGETVHIRFRYGTDDNTISPADFPGWFVDDLELVDLRSYKSVACISSDETPDLNCTDLIEIYINSDRLVDAIETGVEELNGFSLSVAPNPASEYISVGVSAEEKTSVQLLLTSIDGRVIKSLNMTVDSNQSIRTFNTASLEKGMYLIQIQSNKGMTTKKVVIQ